MYSVFDDIREQIVGTHVLLIPALFLVMVLVGFLVVLADSRLNWSIWEFASLTLLVCLIAAPFLFEKYSGKVDLFKPVYMTAFVFFIAFVVSPIIMLVQGWVGVRKNFYRENFAIALFIASIGLIGYYVGYSIIHSRSRSQQRQSSIFSLTRPFDEKKAFALALLAFAVTVAIFYLWLVTANVPLIYLNVFEDSIRYGDAIDIASGGTLYLYLFRLSWPLLSLMMFYLAPNQFWKGFALVCWLIVLALYIMAGNRSNVLIFVASTFIIYYLRRERRPNGLILLLILVLFATFSSFLVSSRGSSTPDDIEYIEELVLELTDRGAAAGLMGTASVFPEKAGHIGLVAISDVIFAPIPRALWPAKPSLRPVQDVMNSQLVSRAHAPGVLGVFYAGFSFFGPFVLLLFYGMLSALIFENWRKNPRSLIPQLLLAGWIPFIWIIIHRGVLSKHIVEMLYRFGPVLLIYFLARVPVNRLEKANTNDAQVAAE